MMVEKRGSWEGKRNGEAGRGEVEREKNES